MSLAGAVDKGNTAIDTDHAVSTLTEGSYIAPGPATSIDDQRPRRDPQRGKCRCDLFDAASRRMWHDSVVCPSEPTVKGTRSNAGQIIFMTHATPTLPQRDQGWTLM